MENVEPTTICYAVLQVHAFHTGSAIAKLNASIDMGGHQRHERVVKNRSWDGPLEALHRLTPSAGF